MIVRWNEISGFFDNSLREIFLFYIFDLKKIKSEPEYAVEMP